MTNERDDQNSADELAETDLDQVSGGLLQFEIQMGKKRDAGSTDTTPGKDDSSKKGVFENVTYKY